MTATLAKPNAELGIYVGDDLSAAGYSDKEISLIGYCWEDAQEINRSKMALAQHLYELKQEMDGDDPSAGAGNNGKSRFWTAFEAGHLPFAGDAGRATVKHSLAAATWLQSRELGKGLPNSFSNLAPSTVYEISKLEPPALELVEQQLGQSDFIGVAAVRLLATEAKGEVLDRLFDWVKEHPSTPLTPKAIRQVKAVVVEESRPASSKTVSVANILEAIRQEAPAREQKARVDAVKEELSRADREQHERLQSKVREYNNKLNAASSSVHELLVFIRSVDRIDGTQYLDDMRAIDVVGLITVQDDLGRLQKIGEDLMETVKLARSSNPPTGIDMTTVQV